MMANQEHLDILKQGVKIWNQWLNLRAQSDEGADLQGANLGGIDLNGIDLSGVDLSGADLRKTRLSHAYISEARFNGANLNAASFLWALGYADFSKANLRKAYLHDANLAGSIFYKADLSYASLLDANLSNTDFSEAILTEATLGGTYIGNVDLSRVKGLETVKHISPSTIGIDTIYRSQGRIPESFLHKAGVPQSFLEIMAALTNRPIEYYTVFISYSNKDQNFAERLYADLQSKGVRCWFAPEDLKIGDKIRPRINESIRLYDKLLLILSHHSVESQWVEQEVETALEKERKEHHIVLFPIRLDKTVMSIDGGWSALIRNTRHIGDFTQWKNHDAYQQAFERLLRDLKAGI